jgi:glycosyltransferase involved in cell wall biosynthesis
MDEVWTTSDLCAKWFSDAGVVKPLKVYEHGIEDIWRPYRRRASGKIRFLHIGEPAPRKGGQLTLDAFRRAFMGRRDVHLTIKAQSHSTIRVYEDNRRGERVRSIIGLPDDFPNITTQVGELSLPQLVSLYHDHDVLVYPSWGEGFGFIPLQALATGMPTICTGAWAPYRRFLSPLELNSTEYESPWPDVHPGNMLKPDLDHLVSLMRKAASDFNSLADHYREQAFEVQEAYDWKTLTRNAFAHLENR